MSLRCWSQQRVRRENGFRTALRPTLPARSSVAPLRSGLGGAPTSVWTTSFSSLRGPFSVPSNFGLNTLAEHWCLSSHLSSIIPISLALHNPMLHPSQTPLFFRPSCPHLILCLFFLMFMSVIKPFQMSPFSLNLLYNSIQIITTYFVSIPNSCSLLPHSFSIFKCLSYSSCASILSFLQTANSLGTFKGLLLSCTILGVRETNRTKHT